MGFQADESKNEIRIFGEIGHDFWSDRSLGAADIIDALDDMPGDVVVRINSFGGSVADGLGIYSALSRHPGHVSTVIEGYAYSIASLIAMAGDTVSMPENALLMIHGPSAVLGEGNASELRQTADILETHAAAMASAYERGGKVALAQIEQWLGDGQDHYFTAAEAAEHGLIDVIAPALSVAATFSLSKLREGVIPMPDPKENESIIAQERDRVIAIQAAMKLPAVGGIAEEKRQQIEAQAIKEGWPIAHVHNALLEALPASEPLGGGDPGGVHSGQPLIQVGPEHTEKVADGMTAAIVFRAGLERDPEAIRRVAENEYTGMSLVELARRNLEAHGIAVRGMNRDKIIGKALSVRADAGITHTSSDFPAVLENALNKAVLLGWTETEETWRQIARIGNIPDFRPAPRSGLGEYPTPPEVPPGKDFTYVTLSDRKETIVLLTYGSMLGITRQALVNDDLSQFSSLGMKQGRAAARRVGDLVYFVLTSNPKMEQDGKSLFDAAHNNIASTAGPPSVTTLDEARRLMALQKDNDDNAHGLNLPLQRVIVPVSLETTTNVLREAEDNPDTVGDRSPNPFRRTFETVADPRLDANSLTMWYASTNPNTYDVIEAGFLEGQTTPYLESRQGWTIDGLESKVRIDCAAIPLDFRTLVQNAGA